MFQSFARAKIHAPLIVQDWEKEIKADNCMCCFHAAVTATEEGDLLNVIHYLETVQDIRGQELSGACQKKVESALTIQNAYPLHVGQAHMNKVLYDHS